MDGVQEGIVAARKQVDSRHAPQEASGMIRVVSRLLVGNPRYANPLSSLRVERMWHRPGRPRVGRLHEDIGLHEP